MRIFNINSSIFATTATALVGCALLSNSAAACGNGYGANYKKCGATSYSSGYSSSGGGGDLSAIFGAAAAILEAAPPVLEAIGDIANQGSSIVQGATSSGNNLFSNLTSPFASQGASNNTQSEPRKVRKGQTTEEHAADCGGMRARLKPHAPDNDWIVDQMARSGCLPNGKPMSLRERTRRALDRADKQSVATTDIFGGIFQSGSPDKKPPKHVESTITFSGR